MDVTPAHYMPFQEEWQLYKDDGDTILPSIARQCQTSMPQMVPVHPDFPKASYAWSVSDDSSPSHHAALSGDFLNSTLPIEEVQNWTQGLGAPTQQLQHLFPAKYKDWQHLFAGGHGEGSAGHEQHGGILNPSDPLTTIQNQGQISPGADPRPDRVARRRPRTQNHSCDPCRAGKKACDLEMGIVIGNDKRPSTLCSSCSTRGLDCTVAWLASRQSSQQIKRKAQTSKRGRASSSTATHDGAQLRNDSCLDSQLGKETPASACETDLVRQFTAREICLEQFRLYVDVVDMPITECLSKGSMPPTFVHGLAALSSLSTSQQLATYWDQARCWIADSWEMNESSPWSSNTSAPHLFFAASILDTLFQASAVSLSCRAPISTTRNASINEASKWVALAAATQYVSHRNEAGGMREREIASTTWHQAKQMVFGNISAVGSFRLALSLILFGIVVPPTSTGGDTTNDEDAAFAHGEGLRRLQELCSQARACVQGDLPTSLCRSEPTMLSNTKDKSTHPVQSFSIETRDDILELIGALQWLVVIGNSVGIATSQGRMCAMPPHIGNGNAGRLLLTKDSSAKVPNEGGSSPIASGRCDQAIQESIISRSRVDLQPITALWRRETAKEVISSAIRESASLIIVMFHAVALLTVDAQRVPKWSEATYDQLHRHLCTFLKLANIWRSGFGQYDKAMSAQGGGLAGQQVRQRVFFCSNDGDLAILLFCKLVDQLEKQLTEAPPSSTSSSSSVAREDLCATIQSTRSYREKHRLVSAQQVSFLASAALELGRERQDEGNDGRGFRTFVKDVAAHPHPFMIVQAHTLAAETFANEVQRCISQMDTIRASEMTAHLDACLQGLKSVKKGLVRFTDDGA